MDQQVLVVSAVENAMIRLILNGAAKLEYQTRGAWYSDIDQLCEHIGLPTTGVVPVAYPVNPTGNSLGKSVLPRPEQLDAHRRALEDGASPAEVTKAWQRGRYDSPGEVKGHASSRPEGEG